MESGEILNEWDARVPFDSTNVSQTRLGWAYARLLDTMAAVAAVMIVFSMMTVTGDVLLRYLFGKGIIWSFEVTEFLLLYTAMLAMPWLARRNGHVQIDLLLVNLPRKWSCKLNATAYVAVACLCLFIAYWATQATINTYTRGIVNAGIVAWPRWALLAVIPPAFLLTAVEYGRLSHVEWRKGAHA